MTGNISTTIIQYSSDTITKRQPDPCTSMEKNGCGVVLLS